MLIHVKYVSDASIGLLCLQKLWIISSRDESQPLYLSLYLRFFPILLRVSWTVFFLFLFSSSHNTDSVIAAVLFILLSRSLIFACDIMSLLMRLHPPNFVARPLLRREEARKTGMKYKSKIAPWSYLTHLRHLAVFCRAFVDRLSTWIIKLRTCSVPPSPPPSSKLCQNGSSWDISRMRTKENRTGKSYGQHMLDFFLGYAHQ